MLRNSLISNVSHWVCTIKWEQISQYETHKSFVCSLCPLTSQSKSCFSDDWCYTGGKKPTQTSLMTSQLLQRLEIPSYSIHFYLYAYKTGGKILRTIKTNYQQNSKSVLVLIPSNTKWTSETRCVGLEVFVLSFSKRILISVREQCY